MSIRNLDKLFAPESVAVLGASRRERAVGQVVMRNLIEGGFPGPIWPVNPKAETICGRTAYPAVDALPEAPELAVIATPPQTVPELVRQLGARGTRAAVVITAGFGELGEEGRRLQQAMLDAARPHLLRIVGPNGLGLIATRAKLNASFSHRQALPGDVAFLSQSGAVLTTVLDWASARRIGFSHLVSLGGMADVDFGDLLDFLARDPETSSILLYVEQITDAPKLMSAARAAARLKPVVVVKPGRHEAAAKAAYSHTGALAGSDAAYDAAFRRAGMLRVRELGDLFDAVETLGKPWKHRGDRLAILTNGGGVGVLAVDELLDAGGRLAQLAPETMARLDGELPRTWSHANPVDIIGDAPGARYAAAIRALDADPGVDAILAMNCPTAVADPLEAARAVMDTGCGKPLLTCWLGEDAAHEARELFEERQVPSYPTPGDAVRAFMMVADYTRNQAQLMEVPPASDLAPVEKREAARALVRGVLAAGRSSLTEPESKALLDAYGIPVVLTRNARTPEEAAGVARELGFPAAVKILSPDISHKSDVGGVALDLEDEAAVRRAAEAVLENVERGAPDARIEGLAVQRMASMPGAVELIAGLVDDSTFGPVVLFGQGGTSVEVVADKAVALPPLNRLLVDDLVARTRVSKLLRGYRDRPPADMDAIAHVLMRLSEMAADLPEVAELDINPLWAGAEGALALDARVRLAPGRPDRLAIRPYPRDLETEVADDAGARYAVRPIRPEDADAITRLVAASSPEDIRMRFFTALQALPRQLAARLTQIDYRREMAFLALEPDGTAAGVARLTADPDNERAEFAILVRTDLKGRGLGTRLMQLLIGYAEAQGIGALWGDVLPENTAMLALCEDLGFTRRLDPEDRAMVLVELGLGESPSPP